MDKKSFWTVVHAVVIFSLTLANPLRGQDDPFTGTPRKPNQPPQPSQPPQPQSGPFVEFRVSKVGADKTELVSVLDAVARLETKTDSKTEAQNYSVNRVIDKKNFLCHKMRKRYRVISSGLSRVGGGGGVSGSEWEEPDTSRLYWVTTQKEQNVVDEEVIKGIIVLEAKEPKKLYDQTYRQLIEVNLAVEASTYTKEQFIADLKQGKTWTLKDFATKSCATCLGKGNLGILRSYVKCASCEGKGSFKVDYLVKW